MLENRDLKELKAGAIGDLPKWLLPSPKAHAEPVKEAPLEDPTTTISCHCDAHFPQITIIPE